MIENPKVCVAICNYNHNKYLAQSIRSIVEQTYENLDIVIVDDGSTEQSTAREIAASHNDARIRFLPLEVNRGKWNALNTAFSTTDADVCTSHDADDVSLNWRIDSQLKAMIETKTHHNLCGFVSCWSEEEVKSNSALARPNELKITSGEQVTNAVLYGFRTPGINHYFTGKFETAGVSAMFHRSLWTMGLRFNPAKAGLRILMSEDSDFNCRATLLVRSTSILMEKPYLYRRNTSTNKEER